MLLLSDCFDNGKVYLHLTAPNWQHAGPASLDRSLLASLLKTAGGTARNAYIQAQALDLVAHTLQHLAAATKGSSKAAGGETSSQLFRLLKPHASALGAAVSAATSGGQGMKPDHHADAVKASIRAVEVCKRATSEAGRKLGELIGPEWQNAVVKAIATVRVGACLLQVERFVHVSLSPSLHTMRDSCPPHPPTPSLPVLLAAARTWEPHRRWMAS
jgi:hypothetical protein